MKSLILVLAFLFCFLGLSAQKSTWLLGTETLSAFIHKKELTIDTTSLFAATGYAPYLGIGMGKNWTVGVSGRYQKVLVNNINLQDYIGVGLFVKYIYKPNAEKLQRFGFPIGITGLRNNFYIEDQQIRRRSNEYLIQGLVGVNFRIWRNLYIEFGYTPQWYVNHGVLQDVSLSFEYRFRGDYDDEGFVFNLDESFSPTAKPTSFARRLVIGNSVSVVFNSSNVDNVNNYWEYSWSKNIATNVIDNFYLGINHIDIWSNDRLKYNSRDHATLVGVFTQYHFTGIESRFKGILELGYYKGNYCRCSKDAIESNPYKTDELLSYWGWGFGMEYQMTDHLSLDLVFNANLILDDLEDDTYGYTMPNIGLNYTLSR